MGRWGWALLWFHKSRSSQNRVQVDSITNAEYGSNSSAIRLAKKMPLKSRTAKSMLMAGLSEKWGW